MRKVVVSNLVSLDGYFAGPNGELDWHIVNDEFFQYAIDLLDSVDMLLLGRVTYQGMVTYWTSANAIENDATIAARMNDATKVVFSKTLDKVEWGKWNNARLVKDNIGDEISKLKLQPGKNMVIYGCGTIVSALTELGLIDDYQIIVVPVILGRGKPLFKDISKPVNLKLTGTQRFKTGVIKLSYEPARQ